MDRLEGTTDGVEAVTGLEGTQGMDTADLGAVLAHVQAEVAVQGLDALQNPDLDIDERDIKGGPAFTNPKETTWGGRTTYPNSDPDAR